MPRGYIRVVLRDGDRRFALFNCTVARDNSFYLHFYRTPGKILESGPTIAPDAAGVPVDPPSFIASGFVEHKLSIHPSGAVHSTNADGRRLRDGQMGIPFAEIIDIEDVVHLVPAHPQTLVECSSGFAKRRATIEIPLGPLRHPLVITFSVIRVNSDWRQRVDNDLHRMAVFPRDQPFGFVLLTAPLYPIQLGRLPVWPSKTLRLTRVRGGA